MGHYCMYYKSPIGTLRLTSNDTALLELIMPCQTTHYPNADENPDLAVLKNVATWLDDYFSGKQPNAKAVPVIINGTAFQNKIWERLRRIPYGQTVTYGQIAAEFSETQRTSAQAVGQAVGANPVSILIPCHRVVGAKKKLIGYNGGLDNKAWLLSQNLRLSRRLD